MNETTQAVDRDRVVLAIDSALRDALDTELPEITEETRLFELGLDSTGVLELLLHLEDELGHEFDSENLRMEHFQSVRSLADFVSAEMGA
ncbi:phosphopantetheine-binding protein [Amycolatopsis vastitatis]|uniref:Acyl carrier protein n=1 Tax=Amycolatopsis vastitatis TaxID=1905142 RepID=A0A229T371_9PSEU|nr:phosphopantetheine-binding protein [Amycolatopsis vastitatis]OXM65199.1 acyl carrier protein [Amycolatopsis vastitatis]